jgi:hypothetical protein
MEWQGGCGSSRGVPDGYSTDTRRNLNGGNINPRRRFYLRYACRLCTALDYFLPSADELSAQPSVEHATTFCYREKLAKLTISLEPRNRSGVEITVLHFEEDTMGFGRGALLWLIGIPLPIILLIALFMHH